MRVLGPATILSLGLVALTLLAYGDLARNDFEFVNFDDYEYVVENPTVKAGLSAKSIRAALTSSEGYNWIPLTWVSFQLDYQLHGLNPSGYHRTNLFLHIVNVVLLFLFWQRATGILWGSAAIAALFAVHPIHVESVAWVTERKDVLSTFFWLLGLHAYIRYAELPTTGRYLGVAACLTLGVMSKPMVATFPCVLFLLDYWPLHRWIDAPATPAPPGSPSEFERFPRRSARRLVLEKVPLFLIVAVASTLQLRAAAELVEESRHVVSAETRWMNAPVSYVVYLRQTVWPADLSVLYLHPAGGVPPVHTLMAVVLLIAVTVLVVLLRRSRPYLLVGWLWYLGTLIPAIGLIQVARQAHADRFTYIPLIGIFLAVCWTVTEGVRRTRPGRVAAALLATIALLTCVLATREQLRCWQNSVALWNRAVEVSEGDPRIHYIASGQFLRSRQFDHALRHAEEMRATAPNDPNAERARAGSLLGQNRFEEALDAMSREAALGQDSAELRHAMARILWKQGRIPESYQQMALVAARKPDSAEGQHYQGLRLQRAGKLEEAIQHLGRAAQLARSNSRYQCDLALALEDAGDQSGAANQYQLAMELNPDWSATCATLAWLLATHPAADRRDGFEAIRWGRMACSLTGYRSPAFLETLAAAYAEAGQFDRAIETAELARKLAQEGMAPELVDSLNKALGLFRNRQPLRSQ